MAISTRCRPFFSPYLLSRLQMGTHTSAGDADVNPPKDCKPASASKQDSRHPSTWKTVDSGTVGINKSAISRPIWTVLKILRNRGYDAYLVGGCVRDLLLKRKPKDFDVVTTASLKQIKMNFHRSRVVGRRFPICHVHIGSSIIEVSSFSTTHKNAKERESRLISQIPGNNDKNHIIRWKDCMKRDFTINGLFYDPSKSVIYDYVDGMRDLSTCKLRTVIPAHVSFKEDCARILRGLRIAARLGLRFTKETATAILDFSTSIMTLDKSRLLMELNFMLAYGAAESSLSLLQKFKILDFLLPIHAAYLADQTRNHSSPSHTMLMKLFSNVDKLLAADRPSDCTLWLGLLAFHLALLHHPQDALVVRTFSSILYHGKLSKALQVARDSNVQVKFAPEISASCGAKSDELLLEEASQLATLVLSSLHAFKTRDAFQLSLERYPKHSPYLGLVPISEKMEKNVAKLFDALGTDIQSYSKNRKTYDIDYKLLKKGDLGETGFVLGKIIMDTMNEEPIHEKSEGEVAIAKMSQPLLSKLFL